MLQNTKRQVNSFEMHCFTMFINALCVIFLTKLRWLKNKNLTFYWLEANYLYARAVVQWETSVQSRRRIMQKSSFQSCHFKLLFLNILCGLLSSVQWVNRVTYWPRVRFEYSLKWLWSRADNNTENVTHEYAQIWRLISLFIARRTLQNIHR